MTTTLTLDQIRDLATTLMAEHGLGDVPFAFDNSKRRAGACHMRRFYGDTIVVEKITLSRHLMAIWEPERVRTTILHEIAHGLNARRNNETGHGPRWRSIARGLGIPGERCYSADAPSVAAPWYRLCRACGTAQGLHRRSRSTSRYSCSKCSGGRFNPAFPLVVVSASEYDQIRSENPSFPNPL